MRKFEDLDVWREAHQVVLAVYRTTGAFPRGERFGLVDQMRRSATSVAGNIAEGCGLRSTAQLVRHLILASGSATELEYYVRLTNDLRYLPTPDAQLLRRHIQNVRRQLWAFTRYLESTEAQKHPNEAR